jgi:8-oxo-dGTP pyrophosphatase MutT (NUDIX family)
MNSNPSQIYPIPVVRALIADARGRILLLRWAATEYAAGGWCLPGGKVDYGQTVKEALAGEILEETSLTLIAAAFFFFQDSLPQSPGGMHCLNLYFLCRASGEFRLNAESSASAWVGPEEVGEYHIVFGNDGAVRRYFESRRTSKA